MSWHRILGVSQLAPYEDVRAAFKRRVLETHPDKGGSASEFRQVMLAFEKASLEAGEVKGPVKREAKRSFRRSKWAPGKVSTKKAPGAVPAKSRDKSVQAIIERLHVLLRQLQRHDRKLAISTKMEERHRMALEAWLQSSLWQKKAPEAPGASPKRSRCVESDEDTNSDDEILALEDFPEEPADRGAEKRRTPSSKAASKGIIRRPGRVKLYNVIVVINNFELFAAGTTDLARAVDVHIALTSLKQRILKSPTLWERLPDELEFSMSAHDLLLCDARLSFRLHFPVHHWTGCGLRSPTYSINELQKGLEIWKELQGARLQYSGLGAKRGRGSFCCLGKAVSPT